MRHNGTNKREDKKMNFEEIIKSMSGSFFGLAKAETATNKTKITAKIFFFIFHLSV